MKKVLSIVIAFVIVFSFTVNIFAVDCVLDKPDIYDENERPEEYNNYDKNDKKLKNKNEKKNDVQENDGDVTISSYTLPSSLSTALQLYGYPSTSLTDLYMYNGTAGYIKYNPPVSAYYTIYTTGALDTYIESYNTGASDDDDGHGLNGCLSFYMNSGTTYYIKIRGYNSYQTGPYTLRLNRGLPTSTYEHPDNFSIFNSSTYRSYTNCYTYALDFWKNPVTNNKFGYKGANPGDMSGNWLTSYDLVDATTAYNKIFAYCQDDAKYYGGNIRPIDKWAQPSEGYFKVALVLWPGNDYHWYRQTPDGRWAHKIATTEAKYTDDSTQTIFMPDECNRGVYTEFLGYFEVKVPAISSSSLSVGSSEEITKIYDKKDDLTINTFKSFSAGTPKDEVKDIIGQEHDYIGSGYIGEVYILKDGTKVVVYFSNDVVDQIRILNEVGSYDIIVK